MTKGARKARLSNTRTEFGNFVSASIPGEENITVRVKSEKQNQSPSLDKINEFHGRPIPGISVQNVGERTSKEIVKSLSISCGDPVHSPELSDTNEEDQIVWLRGHSGQGPKPRYKVMGSDEDPREYDRSRQLFKNGLVLAEVFGLLACFLIIAWLYIYAGGLAWFGAENKPINLHVILMAVFMFYLHGHAAIMYRIYPHSPKYTVKLMHAGLHFIICIATALGLAAAVQHHDINNFPHFYSFHSWLGLTAIIIYYGQFLVGFVSFLLPTTPVNVRNLVLPIHRFCGQAAFSFSAGAVLTGIMLKAIGTLPTYSTLPPAGLLINFGGFAALLFSIVIGNLLGDHRYRRRPRPEGELLLADAEHPE